MSDSLSSWIVRPCIRHSPRLRLVCLPYAGGGASLFRKWPQFLPEDIELLAVQLPGREKRLFDPPCSDLAVIVHKLRAALQNYLDCPLGFFGYSMGTRIAYELARTLREQDNIQPACMFVAACKGPQIEEPPNPRYLLPDKEFKEALRDLGGTPDEVLENTELMDMYLPALRADFALKESYVHSPCPPFDCPITAYCGDHDKEAPQDESQTWDQETTAAFRLRCFPGGHFFIHDNLSELLSDMKSQLHITLREPSHKARTQERTQG